MKKEIIVCKLCGSDELVTLNNKYFCKYCNTEVLGNSILVECGKKYTNLKKERNNFLDNEDRYKLVEDAE